VAATAPARALHPGRRVALPAVTGLAVGIGDGLVGQIPIVDKYPSIHTIYRLLIASGGVLGLALGWDEGLTDSMISGSLALVGARIPAVVRSGQLQQFGNVTAAPTVARALNARPAELRAARGG
jgi:hypothetical protein